MINNWDEIARKSQQPPEGDWKIWLLLAGRGFGKTRTGSETILNLIEKNIIKNIAICGETIFEALSIMLEGPSGILTCSKIPYKYISYKRKVIFKNGAVCQAFGADKYNKLRGFQFDFVWIDEFAKFNYGQEALDQLFLCLRLGVSKMIITTTPQNKQFLLRLMARKDIIITHGNSHENINLSSNFKENLKQYEDTKFGKQEIYGEIIDNKLWNKNDIKYKKSSNYLTYCIGVDPAVEKGTTGIILTALDTDKNIIILEDFSQKDTKPNIWMNIIKNIVNQYYENISIAIETNQGGQLLIDLLKLYEINCEVKAYRAKQSKFERNSFLYTLYERNIVFHSKIILNLEEEMYYHPKDRVDALYWAVWYLYNYNDFFVGFTV